MVVGVIEADDFVQAEKVGRAYCHAHGHEMYVYVKIDGPLVLAGPEILDDGIARDQPYEVADDPNK